MKKKADDETIIAALIQYGTIKEAAAETGLAPRTIYDRMQESSFRALYQEARADVLRGAVSSLSDKVERALQVLADVMENPKESGAARVQAANTLLNHAGKFTDRLLECEKEASKRAQNAEIDKMFLVGWSS